MTGLSISLLLLVGGVAFTVGFMIGTHVFESILRERERQLARERRRINAIWRFLKDRHGIHKPSWMIDLPEKPTEPDQRTHRRRKRWPW